MIRRTALTFAVTLAATLAAACSEEQEPAPDVPVEVAEPEAEEVAEDEETQTPPGRQYGGSPVGTLGLRGLESALAGTLAGTGRALEPKPTPNGPEELAADYLHTAEYAGTNAREDLSSDVSSHVRRATALGDTVADRRRTLGRVRQDSPAAQDLRAEISRLEGEIVHHRDEAERLREALAHVR